VNGRADSERVVLDTRVVRGANAPLERGDPAPASRFAKRVALLRHIMAGRFVVLISSRLLREYRQQVPQARSIFVVQFFALLDRPGAAEVNWQRRWRSEKDDARRCRFPVEDDHVLRTAIRTAGKSTVYTEEHRMIVTDACIHRRFGVRIHEPE
jgi:hypothetical protein